MGQADNTRRELQMQYAEHFKALHKEESASHSYSIASPSKWCCRGNLGPQVFTSQRFIYNKQVVKGQCYMNCIKATATAPPTPS